MTYIYNATDELYQDIDTFLAGYEYEEGTSYYVVFLNDLEVLFTEAKRKTALRGRFAKDEAGAPLLDKLAITDDEQVLFDSAIKKGGAEVFRKLSAWAKNIDQAYLHDVTFEGSTEKYIIFKISLDLGWDLNMLQGVDDAVKEALISSVVKEWYKLNRYLDDYTIEDADYQDSLTRVKSQLLQTRTAVRRPVDMFADAYDSTPAAAPVVAARWSLYEFNTGALVSGVLKTVWHNQNMSSYIITVRNAEDTANVEVDKVYPYPENTANAIQIQVGADIPEGLLIQIGGA